MFHTGLAYAMGTTGGAGQQQGGNPMSMIFIMVGIFAIMYFVMIRPQQKQLRKHQDFLRSLKTGDRIVTTGGLHGEIKGLTDTTVTLEIAEKVRVKVARSAIAGTAQDATAAPESKKE